jgi:methylated-DNA-[protein]-cysteine S-methyltransferase
MTAAGHKWTVHESPLGRLTLFGSPDGISQLYFKGRSPQVSEEETTQMPEAARQLDAYFAGRREAFDLDLDLRGTAFHREVWRLLLEIPYGTTSTYGELARQIDDSTYPTGVEPYRRAQLVGAAIGANPIPILIPCHRVIGADGSLTGYLGGLQRKQALLELETAGAVGRPWAPGQGNRQLSIL